MTNCPNLGQRFQYAVFLLLLIASLPSVPAQGVQPMSVSELGTLKAPSPDARIEYGPEELQFGYLRLPAGSGPHPVVVIIHGGCWLSQYDLEHIGAAAEALTHEGFATWTIEYRRIGNDGGGWPGTFLDVSSGTDHLRQIASRYALDLGRVVVMGHSAGGHLALWVAGRPRVEASSPIHTQNPLPIRGVLALGSVPELEMAYEAQSCNSAMSQLVGGAPEMYPERYAAASPANLFPLGLPQILISGKLDVNWFPFGEAYAAKAQKAGEDVRFVIAPDSGHFEVIVPTSSTWPLVVEALKSLSGDGS